MTNPTRSWSAALLLGLFCLYGVIYAVETPLFEISDELWHYPMVKRLADGEGLPVQDPANLGPWRQEGSQPPLYYLLMAAATSWIDTSDLEQVRWVNPHADNGLITADRNNNIVIHRPDEQRQWHGAALAVRLIRFLSVLMGAGTVYFTYRLAQEVMPGREALALAAAGFAAFTPMFIFISASVNNDNLAVLTSSAALWMLARWLRQPPSRLGWSHAALGLTLGAGALSKQSALGLWPLTGLVLVFVNFRNVRDTRYAIRDTRYAIRNTLLQSLVVFGLALLTSFWWYWRNWQLYGDWLGWNTFVEIVGPRSQPATLAQLWGERVGFVWAYWGLFGGVSVPMPEWVYTVLNFSVGLALLGLGWGAARVAPGGAALWLLPIAWIVLIVAGLIRWTSLTQASQGRLIFPAISAISLLVIVGLAQITHLLSTLVQQLPVIGHAKRPSAIGHRPREATIPFLVVGFMAVLAAAVPFTVIAPHYRPPPELSPAQIAALPHRVDADFSGEMKLLGYDLHGASVHPGGSVRVTLYWQSLIAMDRNWSVFLHIVDNDGIIVAQRDRYPGQGLLATTFMRPGQTFADDYVVAIPTSAYTPANARIRVGLYDLRDGARLSVTGEGLSGTSVMLGALALLDAAHAERVRHPIRQNFGNMIELTGYDLHPRLLHPGDTLTVSLAWKALAPIQTNYSVSVRVRDAYLNRWAAQDSWPQQGAAPTSTWRVGELIPDPYRLILNPDTPPGQYDVEVVVYDATMLKPLRLVTADGRPIDAESVLLSPVRVMP